MLHVRDPSHEAVSPRWFNRDALLVLIGPNAQTSQTTQETTQVVTQKTTQEIILDELRRNPRITRNELAAQAGVSSDTVKYHLQKLTRAGVLRREGSTRSGAWVVVRNTGK